MEHEQTHQNGGPGNTKTGPQKGRIAYRAMFFTWNNYSQKDIDTLNTWFKGRKHMEYIFQEEIGENGTPHLQGAFKCKNAINFDTLKNLFPKAHWEKVIHWPSAVEYCNKDDTRKEGTKPYYDIKNERLVRKDTPDPLKGATLYKWQIKLLRHIKGKPHPRKVIWIFDYEGKAGKTTLAKHLMITQPKDTLYFMGKSADCKFALSKFIEKHKQVNTVIFGFSRQVENFVSYQAIEEVKDGLCFNTKFESCSIVFDIPHVIIFANFPPDKSKLSADRWSIRQIKNGSLYKPDDKIDDELL